VTGPTPESRAVSAFALVRCRAVSTSAEAYGRLDHAVNGAGVGASGPFLNLSGISGVGESKLAKDGEGILEVLGAAED
jgi:hypothetical protein